MCSHSVEKDFFLRIKLTRIIVQRYIMYNVRVLNSDSCITYVFIPYHFAIRYNLFIYFVNYKEYIYIAYLNMCTTNKYVNI